MATAKIIDTDKGMKSFRRFMKQRDRPAVVAGFRENGPGGQQHSPDSPLTVADVAALNEFGTDTIPSRPFMRITADANQDKWQGLMNNVVREAVDASIKSPRAGGAAAARGMSRVGLQMESDIRATIDSSVGPVNADSTIAKKGSSGTLIDSGQMKQSIDSEVRKL